MKKLLAFAVPFFISVASQAQVQLGPLHSDPARAKYQTEAPTGNQRTSALALPFFDDFAGYGYLNSAKWDPAGGAYVNNTFGKGQPTKNVVTLDGLKADGKAYNISASNPGEVDILTSKVIDLSGVTAGDSLYLSFFYQRGGNGHAPGTNDKLYVEFKKGNGNWQEENSIILGGGNSNFKQAIFYVPKGIGTGALSYYHAGFQFRFRAEGFQGGAGDIWNVDYVYLNTGRTKADTAFYDVATTEQPTSLLTPYSAMPIKHFLNSPPTFIKDRVIQKIANLDTVSFRIVGYIASAKNVQQPTNEPVLLDTIQYFTPYSRHSTIVRTGTQVHPLIDNTSDPRQLQFKYYLKSPLMEMEPLEKRYNDTISRKHDLSNYFAYDDGTAERSYNPMTGTQVAVKIVPAIDDTLKAIDFYFLPFGDDLSANSIRVKVWAVGQDGKPDVNTILFEQSMPITYNGINHFNRIELPQPLAISGPFFVGWSQTFGAKHAVGFDVNSDSREFRYYAVGGNWYSDDLEGSLMVRAIMGGMPLTSAPALLSAATDVLVYPNPGSGIFYITPGAQVMEVYDAKGSRMQINGRYRANEVDLRGLPGGLYVLRVKKQDQISTHKVLLQRN